MKLNFSDATSILIQSYEKIGNAVRFLIIGTAPEKLREIFEDAAKTKVMNVTERGQVIDTLENYTGYDHTEIYPGGIYGVVINKVGMSTEERLSEVEEDVKNLQESGVGVDAELFHATVFVARTNAQTLDDQDALQVKAIYETWDELVKKNFTAVDAGYKFTHQDVLYKTINPGQQFQAQWIPGQETESIFTRIDEEHTGTKADPIPYHVNMEVFEGKYYTEDGILYRCTRNSGQALQNKASELVGHYFEAVK